MNKKLNKFEIKSQSWRPVFFVYSFTILFLGYFICIPFFFVGIAEKLFEIRNICGILILIFSIVAIIIFYYEGKGKVSIFIIDEQKIEFLIPNKSPFIIQWLEFNSITVYRNLEIISGGFWSEFSKIRYYYKLEFIGDNFEKLFRFKACNYGKRDFSNRKAKKVIKALRIFANKENINKNFKEEIGELRHIYSP